MQDINRGNSFNENEGLSLDEKNRKSNYQGLGTAFSELDTRRKIAVIFLAFFSIVLFFVWGITMKNRINSPLNPEISTEIPAEIFQEGDVINRDRDGDGLTDWEEENLYNTSPYLDDTDSDGILDGQEVESGSDPNCSEGDICVGDILQEREANDIEINNFINENINLETKEGIGEEDFTKVLEGGSDVATLRKMLMEAGMDEEILNTISDEDLLSSYQEILQ